METRYVIKDNQVFEVTVDFDTYITNTLGEYLFYYKMKNGKKRFQFEYEKNLFYTREEAHITLKRRLEQGISSDLDITGKQHSRGYYSKNEFIGKI